jgi:small subunit ribosomal protein S9
MAKKKESAAAGKKAKKEQLFHIGKRRMAVAKISIRPGSGRITINGEPLQNVKSDVLRLRMQEPFILTEKDEWKAYDFIATVKGGGTMGQADAVRQAFARGLAGIFGGELRQKFLDYDRSMLVYDPRRTEPHKPPRSSQGPRRAKQKSKR